jgi:hypothetical protein
MTDFFVSYSHNDQRWAEWIGDVLVKASYSVIVPGVAHAARLELCHRNHKAASECKRTIAVLSPDYLASLFTQAEWAAAFAADPSGKERKLIPIRVRICEPPGLLKGIVYCDLIGFSKANGEGRNSQGGQWALRAYKAADVPGRQHGSRWAGRDPFPDCI